MFERLYRSLYRIRCAEEEIARVYPTDRIKSPIHLSIGQEGVSVGVCEALDPGDIVFGTYRSHALYLAKGGSLQALIAELHGKATGCTKGKGGSMHLIDVAAGMMGTSAVVATAIPQAVGYALALKMKHSNAIVAVFFGDGALEEGAFHESMNFAALKQVPVLFVCENNFFAVHSRLRDRQPLEDLHKRAECYSIPSRRVADADVVATVEAAQSLVAAVRSGEGPRFLECAVWRWREHVGPGEDYGAGYRDAAEAAPWLEADPVLQIRKHLDASARVVIEREVDQEVREAFECAQRSPEPDAAELYTDVFKEK